MGFYIRKSLRVGPVRFNLSKSGIGVSAGIKGLRVGSGPRGNYIHMGRGGLYYRATLPSGGANTPTLPSAPTTPPLATTDAMTEIESGSVRQMTDSSSENLLRELNEKRRKWRLRPWVLVFSLVVAPQLSAVGAPEAAAAILMLLGLVATPFVAYWDRMRRTTVLLYDIEADAVTPYEQLHDAFDALIGCARTWHMSAKGATRDRKRNAGASTLVQRKRVTLSKTPPNTVKTNIDVPSIPVGRQVLCFFPDRLLVFDRDGVGAVSYRDLNVGIRASRFIEDEGVPSDAEVVGQTWRYVNKNGGPDKRFKNNRQLPICLYEEVEFTSGTGLNEVIQLSKTAVGSQLAVTITSQFCGQDARRAV
jgi:hypothetical protein